MADDKRTVSEEIALSMNVSDIVKGADAASEALKALGYTVYKTQEDVVKAAKGMSKSMSEVGGLTEQALNPKTANRGSADQFEQRINKQIAQIEALKAKLQQMSRYMAEYDLTPGRTQGVLDSIIERFSNKVPWAVNISLSSIRKFGDDWDKVFNQAKINNQMMNLVDRVSMAMRKVQDLNATGGIGGSRLNGQQLANAQQGLLDLQYLQQLPDKYDRIGVKLRDLNKDAQAIQRAMYAGFISPEAGRRTLEEIEKQKQATTALSKGVVSDYTKMQITTSAALNTFQSLAAGQPVMTTLITQGTQLLGIIPNLSIKWLLWGTTILGAAGALAGFWTAATKTQDALTMNMRRMDAATNSAKGLADVYERLNKIGTSTTGLSGSETSGLFLQFRDGAKFIATTNDELVQVMTTLIQLEKMGGVAGDAIVKELSALPTLFKQTVINGDEFQRVLSGMPAVANQLARAYGVSRDELYLMAQQGKITGRDLYQALLGQSDEVNKKFAQMPATFGDEWDRMIAGFKSSWEDFVKWLDASGTSTAILRAVTGQLPFANTYQRGQANTQPNQEFDSFDALKNAIGGGKGSLGPAGDATKAELIRIQGIVEAIRKQESGMTEGVIGQLKDLNTIVAAGGQAWQLYGMQSEEAAARVQKLKDGLTAIDSAARTANNAAALFQFPRGPRREEEAAVQSAREGNGGYLSLPQELRVRETAQRNLNNSLKDNIELQGIQTRETKENAKAQGSLSATAGIYANAQNRVNALVDKYGEAARYSKAASEIWTQANAEAGAVISRNNKEIDLAIQQNNNLIAAYGQGEAAVRKATYANRELEASVRGQAAISKVRAQNESDEAKFRAEYTKNTVQDLQDQAAYQEAYAKALLQGGAAVEAVRIAEQKRIVTLKLGKDAQADVNKVMEAYEKNLKAQAAAENAQTLQNLQIQYGKIAVELKGVAAGYEEAAVAAAKYDYASKQLAAGKPVDQGVLDWTEKVTRAQVVLDRQKDVFNELSEAGSQAFDRIGEAITQAFARGEDSAVSLKSTLKALYSEMVQTFLRLSVINPLKNWAFGQNNGTIFDMFGGGSTAQLGSINGMGFTNKWTMTNDYVSPITNMAQNYAYKQGMQYMIGQNSTLNTAYNNLMNTTLFGGTVASGALANSLTGSGAIGLGSMSGGAAFSGTAGGAGVMAVPGGMTNAVASSGTYGAGLSTVGSGMSTGGFTVGAGLGAAGAGAFGGTLGGMIGTATNSKALGGISGAALGAGSAWAMGAMMGSSFGPIGTAIGAVIGAIVGLLTTSKASVGPNGGANISFDGRGAYSGLAQGDNDFDAAPLKTMVDAASLGINAAVKSGGGTFSPNYRNEAGITYFASDRKYRIKVGDDESRYDDPEEATIALMRKSLNALVRDGNVTGLNPDVLHAANSSTAKKADEYLKDLDFAAGFRDTFTSMQNSMDPVNGQLAQFRKNAEDIGKTLATSITDFWSKAKELGLATDAELVPALRQTVEVMMGLRKPTDNLKGMDAVTKQADVSFQQYHSTLVKLGYTTQEIDNMYKQFIKDAQEKYIYNFGTVRAKGATRIETAINPDFQPDAYTFLRTSGLSKDDLLNVGGSGFIRNLDNFRIGALSGKAKDTDLRWIFNVANDELYNGRISEEVYNGVIEWVAGLFENSKQKDTSDPVIDPYEDIRKRIKDAYDNILGKGDSGTTPLSRLTTARTTFDNYVNVFNDPNKSEADRKEAGDKIAEWGQNLIDAAKDFYGSTDLSDMKHVLTVFRQIGNISGSTGIPGLGFAGGGVIGNGMYGVDSLIAKNSLGANIFLAGGEYVMPAAATSRNFAALEAMRSGSYSENSDYEREVCSQLASVNENLTKILRVLMASGEATVNELREVKGKVDTMATLKTLEEAL